MKIRILLFISLIINSYLLRAQVNYGRVDSISTYVPDSLTKVGEIATYLTRDLDGEAEKLRAIYIWVSHNITYDIQSINTDKRYASDNEIVLEVLANRKGLCQHYSELLLAMCNSVGLKCFVIGGFTQQVSGIIDDYSHAWNGVLIENEYSLIDATWAAGYLVGNKYVHKFRDEFFMIKPQTFIQTHIPFDPIWQFLDYPLSYDEFHHQDLVLQENKSFYNFPDSIVQYHQHKRAKQLEGTLRRMANEESQNSITTHQQKEYQLQLTNLLYNQAIDTANYAILNYNTYITYRNRQFRNPKVREEEIQSLINNAKLGLDESARILENLESENIQLQNLINSERARLPKLKIDVNRESDFVDKYLKTWNPLRPFIFLTFN